MCERRLRGVDFLGGRRADTSNHDGHAHGRRVPAENRRKSSIETDAPKRAEAPFFGRTRADEPDEVRRRATSRGETYQSIKRFPCQKRFGPAKVMSKEHENAAVASVPFLRRIR